VAVRQLPLPVVAAHQLPLPVVVAVHQLPPLAVVPALRYVHSLLGFGSISSADFFSVRCRQFLPVSVQFRHPKKE
jgi:hypothetical protein